MSAPRPDAPVARDREFWIVGSGLVIALAVVAAIAAWPIYAALPFVVLVAVSVVVAGGLALLLVTLRRWSALRAGVVIAGAFLLLGVPLAVPTALRSIDAVPRGFLDLLTGVVLGWKQLVTIAIPVGDYQATSVPALVVFLVGSFLAFVATWRTDRLALLAAPLLVLMQAFGLLFGVSDASSTLRAGPFALAAPRETGLGLLALALLVVLLVWRASWLRRRALRVAAVATGVHNVATHRATALRRAAVGGAMLGVAALIAGLAVPAFAGTGRDVLRSAVEPDLRVRDAVSPLSTYRESFAGAADDTVLLRVDQQSGPALERLRLATLSAYDGQVFRIAPAGAAPGEGTDFRRVPAELPGHPDGERSVATVTIDGLEGIWLPLPDGVAEVDFAGSRANTLAESFYYSQTLQSGVELAEGGLAADDEIVVQAVAGSGADVSTFPTVPADARPDAGVIPDELVEWVDRQDLAEDGAGLAELVERLRARGYLSHSLQEPTGQSWVGALGDYDFAPSLAGHSLDRVAQLFAGLIQRENELGVSADTEQPDAMLVAAVGDDEQFATAAALIARHLGYESRVALGFRLTDASGITAPAPCAAGECRGANLTAWTEVRGPDGTWAVLDATPQYENPLTPSVDSVRDPEIPTEVPSQVAETTLPPESSPADSEGRDDTPEEPGIDLGWLWATLRVIGIVLLVAFVLLAPFLAILAAKTLRRNGRRRSPDPEARIAGGWLEWVDAAIDHGVPVPGNATRTEVAAAIARRTRRASGDWTDAGELARSADRAVFAAVAPDDDDGDAFWRIVDAERTRWDEGLTWWRRFWSAISLASFTRRVDARGMISRPMRELSVRWSPARGATSSRLAKGVTRTRRPARP